MALILPPTAMGWVEPGFGAAVLIALFTLVLFLILVGVYLWGRR